MLCLGALHRGFEAATPGARRSAFCAAGLLAGLAVLTKGAIGYALPGGAVLLWAWLHGRLRVLLHPLHVLPAAALALAVGGSWYLALGWLDGAAFMEELFWEHHVGRFLSPKQGHGGSLLYYVPVLLVGCLPWSPLLLLALWRARAGGVFRGGDERARFVSLILVFAALTFGFFSLAGTKLPNYVFPVAAVAGIPVADLLRRLALGEDATGLRVAVRTTAVALGVLGLALLVAPAVLPYVPELAGRAVRKLPGLATPLELGAAPFLAGAVLLVAGGAAWRLAAPERLAALVAVVAGALACTSLVVVLLGLPRYDAHFRRPLVELGRRAAALSGGAPFFVVGLRHVPSVTFYSGTLTRYASAKRARSLATVFRAHPAVGLTTEPYLENVRAAGEIEVVGRDTGYVLFRTRGGSGRTRAPTPP